MTPDSTESRAVSVPSALSQMPLIAFLSDSYLFQWENQSLREDWVFVLPVALCLCVGLAVGHPAAGMIAAGGAVNIGFGAKQNIDNSQLLPMIFATLGTAFSTFIGMMVGHENFLLVGMAALWGFGCGMLTMREAGYAWVGQQCVIMLVVGSAFPASAEPAAERSLLVLAGSALQVLSSSLILRLFGQLREHLRALTTYIRAEQDALRQAVRQAAAAWKEGRLENTAVPYSLRLAITLALSTLIYRQMHFASGYWIPMTALLVLKPGLADTVSRAIARTLGTVAGAWLISIFVAHFTPSPAALVAFTLLFTWLSYGVQNVNYALFALCVTGYIVFLLSLDKLPEIEIAQRRAVCTVIGGGLALAVRLVLIYRWRKRLTESSRAGALQ
ncbi:MAG TPA: FUSC family protein [Silvibacterium sp.]|nr:FUSC family protein [Silvibacterium sp.]